MSAPQGASLASFPCASHERGAPQSPKGTLKPTPRFLQACFDGQPIRLCGHHYPTHQMRWASRAGLETGNHLVQGAPCLPAIVKQADPVTEGFLSQLFAVDRRRWLGRRKAAAKTGEAAELRQASSTSCSGPRPRKAPRRGIVAPPQPGFPLTTQPHEMRPGNRYT